MSSQRVIQSLRPGKQAIPLYNSQSVTLQLRRQSKLLPPTTAGAFPSDQLQTRYSSTVPVPRRPRSCRSESYVPSRAHRHNLSTASMAVDAPNGTRRLEDVLSSDVLEDVRTLWFQHLKSDEIVILPPWSDCMRWFSKNEELDQSCM